MEENGSFLQDLEEVLNNYREYLDTKELPKLKEYFILFKSVYDGFTNLLFKKGLITEDPYKYEVKISEVEPPSRHPVIDSEKVAVMSQRLSQFERQLDFLNHFFQFSADFMTLPRIKNISALVKWVDWDNLNGSSMEVNTQILGGITEKIKQGADSMSSSLLADSIKKMGELSRQILGVLRKVSMYQREKYKFEIRTNIMIPLGLTGDKIKGREDETLSRIKSAFRQKMDNGTPFIKSLILELINEETSPDSEKMKQEILKKFEIKKKVKKKKEINLKPLLLEALKMLSAAGISLNDALNKIQHNSALLENRNLSFGEKFRMWIMNISGKNKHHVYDIEYMDEATSSRRRIKIELNSFLEKGFKEARIVSALANKMSNIYQKLEASTEDSILTFLDNHTIAIKEIVEKLDPLNVYFKSEIPRTERSSVKGIKLEISSIKSSLRKANQKKLEYIARSEEIKQMKKLGIDTSIEEE